VWVDKRTNGYYEISSRFSKTGAHAPEGLENLTAENIYKHIMIFAAVTFICEAGVHNQDAVCFL
jgi:hypothetical protein